MEIVKAAQACIDVHNAYTREDALGAMDYKPDCVIYAMVTYAGPKAPTLLCFDNTTVLYNGEYGYLSHEGMEFIFEGTGPTLVLANLELVRLREVEIECIGKSEGIKMSDTLKFLTKKARAILIDEPNLLLIEASPLMLIYSDGLIKFINPERRRG